MKKIERTLIMLLAVACTASAVRAQDRADLIEQARTMFDDSAAVQRLHDAMDPALGEPDSLWALAGFRLATVFLRTDQPDRAARWLRAVARHAPTYPIDPVNFPPNVVAAYESAVAEVAAQPDAGVVATRWQWPSSLAAQAEGTIEVASDGPQLEVTVETIGRIQPGGIMSLPPGPYTIAVSSDGWEPVRVNREVLPGTALMIDVSLVPLLAPAAEAAAAANVVRITFQRAGAQICRSGYVATSDGYVLTTLDAVRDASGISVSAFGGTRTFTDVPVVMTDAARDLAVLRLPVDSTVTPSRVASDVSTGDWVWSVQSTTCADPAADRSRLESWSGSAVARLVSPLPASAAGAPLVDRSGFLVGIVTGPSSALPDALTRDVIERARTLIAVQVRPPTAGGGFPWKWVGLGAAVAGAGVALAGGGGGDDGDDQPQPTTGGIIITFPGN